MYRDTKEPVCIKCKGQGVIEVFEPEIGFEVLIPCTECDRGIEDSLRRLLEGVGGKEVHDLKIIER
jgi:hypothetical protein